MNLESPEALGDFLQKVSRLTAELWSAIGATNPEQQTGPVAEALATLSGEVTTVAAALHGKSMALAGLREEYRKILSCVAEASRLLRGTRHIPVWLLYRDGEERVYSFTTPPSQAWTDLQRKDGYVLVQIEVAVPDAADFRMGQVAHVAT